MVHSQKICGKTYFNSNSMLVVLIACGYVTLMYREQSFIKNVYGMSFDISEIILRVRAFLYSENSLHFIIISNKYIKVIYTTRV